MTRRTFWVALALVVTLSLAPALAGAGETSADWAMKATIIEACSCPMFCQCYFNSEPASHGGHHGEEGEHYCKFNMAFRVDSGHHGETSLDGVEYWVAGDLGDDFSDGEMSWAVLTFDPAVTPEQRAGVAAAMAKLFPVKWSSFQMAEDAEVEWWASKEKAVAKLAGGEKGELVLKAHPGMRGDSVVLSNVAYWGAEDHDGFVMMPNEVQAWRGDERKFETRGTNGFMITVQIDSESPAPAAAADASGR